MDTALADAPPGAETASVADGPPAPSVAAAPLVSVEDLRISFRTERGLITAVDGVSFAIPAGKTLGVVGESGCGKSVTSLAIMGLLPSPPASVTGTAIRFGDRDLLTLDAEARRRMRGRELSMIFQEPMTSLNPVYTVGDQIIEGIQAHERVSASTARARAIELLDLVKIPAPDRRIDTYPHEMSGGMRQRVMIAMALACRPKLLIADEPTTALDVTIQAQILDLLRDLQAETGTAILLITHDLGVVAEMADEVVVMYAGKVAEQAPVATLFDDPQHPYTIGLLGSIPRLDEERDRLAAIEGAVPSPAAMPAGCRFAPRCPFTAPVCTAEAPPLRGIGPEHRVACARAPLEAQGGPA